MRRFLGLILVLASVSLARGQATKPVESAGPRFGVVDVFVDSKDRPLGAYQFEFKAETGQVKLVGVEGGEAEAFAKTPPYYDPAALGQRRVIVAAFSTDATGLPRGRSRIARLHVMIEGLPAEESPKYAATLEVAADGEGRAIQGATLMVK